MVKEVFFLIIALTLIFGGSSCILYEEPYDYCYERDLEHPEECWETRHREECCEWRVSRRCVEIWCSDLDYYGYNECHWRFEERYCY